MKGLLTTIVMFSGIAISGVAHATTDLECVLRGENDYNSPMSIGVDTPVAMGANNNPASDLIMLATEYFPKYGCKPFDRHRAWQVLVNSRKAVTPASLAWAIEASR